MFDEEGSAASQSASYLSGAADDVYLQAASYSYSPMRFNVRGYEQRESSTYINGVNFQRPRSVAGSTTRAWVA